MINLTHKIIYRCIVSYLQPYKAVTSNIQDEWKMNEWMKQLIVIRIIYLVTRLDCK